MLFYLFIKTCGIVLALSIEILNLVSKSKWPHRENTTFLCSLLLSFQYSFIRRIKGENVFIKHSNLMLEVGEKQNA